MALAKIQFVTYHLFSCYKKNSCVPILFPFFFFYYYYYISFLIISRINVIVFSQRVPSFDQGSIMCKKGHEIGQEGHR